MTLTQMRGCMFSCLRQTKSSTHKYCPVKLPFSFLPKYIDRAMAAMTMLNQPVFLKLSLLSISLCIYIGNFERKKIFSYYSCAQNFQKYLKIFFLQPNFLHFFPVTQTSGDKFKCTRSSAHFFTFSAIHAFKNFS